MDQKVKDELQKSPTIQATRALVVKQRPDPKDEAEQSAQLATRDAMVAAYAEEARKIQAAMVEAGTWEGGRDLDWHDAFMADQDGKARWEDFSVKNLPDGKAKADG